MGRILKKFWLQLDEGVIKDVFDNLRNFLVCALLFGAGSNALHGDSRLFLGLFVSHLAGWGLIWSASLMLWVSPAGGEGSPSASAPPWTS